ncbi:hypothetical protein OIO03_20385, partial [Acinetobacter baumannii]|nr:hypothetical protein [Acinetobacter baumannii]MCW1765969.1 hypothetical protein [Acinetobacter baumannii]
WRWLPSLRQRFLKDTILHQHVLVRNGFSREQVCSSKMEEMPECIDAGIHGGVDVLFSPSIARL